jgi:hypothetical protein
MARAILKRSKVLVMDEVCAFAPILPPPTPLTLLVLGNG